MTEAFLAKIGRIIDNNIVIAPIGTITNQPINGIHTPIQIIKNPTPKPAQPDAPAVVTLTLLLPQFGQMTMR